MLMHIMLFGMYQSTLNTEVSSFRSWNRGIPLYIAARENSPYFKGHRFVYTSD